MEDLDEWKDSLEKALVAAPPALLVGEGAIFRHDSIDAGDEPLDQGRERRPVKSLVVGRPILLALEDIDGSPSFLEKALCFIEQYGVKVEGVLRQSADVDDVDQRIRDYEKGMNQFGIEEDAHVIGDCIKHVLRELPSSPVPTPCCTALLEAYRVESREARIKAMRVAVKETFPEPNRRLLQRVLKMMAAVVSHSSENRMTASAVAACMAPLLLRPLLAGECGLEDDSDVSGDNASQLLAAAAAANSAQAIITTLLEDHDKIFEVNMEPPQPSFDMYPQEDDSGSEGLFDEEVAQAHNEGYQDAHNELDIDLEEDPDRVVSGQFSESSGNEESDIYDIKVFEGADSEAESSTVQVSSGATGNGKDWPDGKLAGMGETSRRPESDAFRASPSPASTPWGEADSPSASPKSRHAKANGGRTSDKVANKAPRSASSSKRSSVWGLSSIGKRSVSASAEATDSSGDEELAIQRLEATRQELCNKIAKEAKGNAELQASLERRKQALHERRLALEQDVVRLQEQLQAERDLRAALELGLGMHSSQLSMAGSFDNKTRAELEEIAVVEADVSRLKQKVTELHLQLSQQRQQQGGSLAETNERYQRVKKLQAQQKVLQQELERTLALCHSEKQKNSEIEGRNGAGHMSTLEQVILHHRNALAEAKETLKIERARGIELRRRALQQDSAATSEWRQLQPPAGPSSSARQFAWRHGLDTSTTDARQFESLATCINDGSSTDLQMGNSAMFQRPQVPSYALAELSSKLDFFKERRSQLMEQLHNLDLKFTPPSSANSQDGTYSSPQWTRQH
ncbi:hypothetical protein KP509_01G024700 [Ceratopteris richardii]|uniref:Rho-GAP domain-containing protein n=3 Tax=Ceratopteris richardii TaxID=49495 RepID=A0A8T2VEK7_CERRI|nr:hypothetical protein KP509_01G024700 [Ceratopteris richardii]